jgi:hypothetical protein
VAVSDSIAREEISMPRLFGIVIAVALLGVGIAGSETAKAAKNIEAVTQVPTPTLMPAGKPGAPST